MRENRSGLLVRLFYYVPKVAACGFGDGSHLRLTGVIHVFYRAYGPPGQEKGREKDYRRR